MEGVSGASSGVSSWGFVHQTGHTLPRCHLSWSCSLYLCKEGKYDQDVEKMDSRSKWIFRSSQSADISSSIRSPGPREKRREIQEMFRIPDKHNVTLSAVEMRGGDICNSLGPEPSGRLTLCGVLQMVSGVELQKAVHVQLRLEFFARQAHLRRL